jgi:hypothetical protein
METAATTSRVATALDPSTEADNPWQIRVKPTSVSILVDPATVYTCDLTGRPRSFLADGVHYRRGLDGRVRARPVDAAGGRRWLSQAAGAELWDSIRSRLAIQADVPGLAGFRLTGGVDQDHLAGWLQRLLSWDLDRCQSDEAAFRRLYTSVPILPPDHYNALVLQATRGCPWNRCTFCRLYHDRAFEALTPEAFEAHLAQVRAYFGAGLSARRHLFLGDANLLVVPPRRLRALLQRTRSAFPEPALEQIGAFADVLAHRRHTDNDLRQLRELGLQRIYFGLESGSLAVRSVLGKMGDRADAVTAVRRLRAAGMGVGVIVLLGAGGQGLAADHEAETREALRAMGLAATDTVLFSSLRAHGEYGRRAREALLGELDETQQTYQRRAIEAELPPHSDGGPRRLTYDIDDFVY